MAKIKKTETGWLAANNWFELDLGSQFSKNKRHNHRKFRLLGIAMTRLAMTLIPFALQLEQLADAAERYLDDQMTWGELKSSRSIVLNSERKKNRIPNSEFGISELKYRVVQALDSASSRIEFNQSGVPGASKSITAFGVANRPEFMAGCDHGELLLVTLARDIFGNPFRPVTFDPAWRTSETISIAGRMYDSRDFSAMPILADALEEAGCTNPDLLLHCRELGVHVRGCWVVDLVLGKS